MHQEYLQCFESSPNPFTGLEAQYLQSKYIEKHFGEGEYIRMEAKHACIKGVAQIGNFINTPYAVALRHQRMLVWRGRPFA